MHNFLNCATTKQKPAFARKSLCKGTSEYKNQASFYMSRQSELFLAILCYVILMALPFMNITRLPIRYERALPAECPGGNLLVEGVCAVSYGL